MQKEAEQVSSDYYKKVSINLSVIMRVRTVCPYTG